MAAQEEVPPAPQPGKSKWTQWLWKSTPPAPAQQDPMDARMKTLSKQCEGNALDVEEEAMVTKIAPGPTPPAPSVAAKATMTKSVKTDSWAMSEAMALLPIDKG